MSRGGEILGSNIKYEPKLVDEKIVTGHNLLSISPTGETWVGSIKAVKRFTSSEGHLSQEGLIKLPLFLGKVAAGRPFFVEVDVESHLDLNDYLVSRPASTFFMQVSGNSMAQTGIHDGDILIVDRSLEAKNDSIVIAILNSELTIKRLISKKGKYYLRSEDNACDLIEITDEMDFYTWGVVTTVIHQFVKV